MLTLYKTYLRLRLVTSSAPLSAWPFSENAYICPRISVSRIRLAKLKRAGQYLIPSKEPYTAAGLTEALTAAPKAACPLKTAFPSICAVLCHNTS